MKKARIILATMLAKTLVRLRIANIYRVSEIRKLVDEIPEDTPEEVTFIMVRSANAMFKKRHGHKVKKLKPLP